MTINVFQPSCGEEELEAVREVFASNWLGKGKRTAEFERRFKEWLRVDFGHVLSCSCCTEGLFQIMDELGLGPGDEVILPSCHFVGTANAIAARGARPVFCDVEERTLNTSAAFIEQKVTEKTRAVCLLHYGGVPCDMDEIVSLCEERKIVLVEDAATAVASSYKGQACGTFGWASAWSFDAMKLLVCGDGGMIFVRDAEAAERLQRKLYLGLLSTSGFTNKVDARWWHFQIDSFGRRATMNDIAASIGLVQLGKLPSFIAKRKQIHEYYDELLASCSWLLCPPPLDSTKTSSCYLYWIQVAEERERDELALYLRQNDVYTTFRYYPLHQVSLYGHDGSPLPHVERASRQTLCLPLHQAMTFADVEKICTLIHDFRRGA